MPRPALSELENTVMSVVWRFGRATAEEVREELKATQPMKDSTVRTILRRLEEKGYADHEVEGRTYVYVPTGASRNVAADAVRGIIERFCGGSVEDLLIGMVDRDVVSSKKLEQLARRIASAENRTKAQSRPKGRGKRK